MNILGYSYVIGDPEIRDEIRKTARVAWKSVVGAFAVIGVLSVLTVVLQIVAW